MLSNVTKSADVLRGATEMQDLWADLEREYPIAGLKGPRVLQGHIMQGKAMLEKEARDDAERKAHVRQQRNNFYMSESAKKLKQRATLMDPEERKEIRDRLATRPNHTPPRPKSPTNTGHIMPTGELSPGKRDAAPYAKPPIKAVVSTPGTEVKSSRQQSRSKFEGLTMQDFYSNEWRPSFTYRPAKQDEPWQNVEGFSMSTRTLERRKMDPFADINSFQGNRESAKAQFASQAHVRPIDVKGNLGARPVQKWKESLREGFARDDDNFSSNAHDRNLDEMRKILGTNGSDFSSVQ